MNCSHSVSWCSLLFSIGEKRSLLNLDWYNEDRNNYNVNNNISAICNDHHHLYVFDKKALIYRNILLDRHNYIDPPKVILNEFQFVLTNKRAVSQVWETENKEYMWKKNNNNNNMYLIFIHKTSTLSTSVIFEG